MTTSSPHDYQASLNPLLDSLRTLIIELATLIPGSHQQAEQWFSVLEGIRSHLAEDLCRVAVVGTVKAGKSTLINALLGQDVLKRGAGIVTAMITRLQPAPEPQARLVFKDWEEINGEINRALTFFPSPLLRERTSPLDLREPGDRELLLQVLAEVDRDRLLQQDSLDQNYVLLASYAEGYPPLQEKLSRERRVLELRAAELAEHQSLVSRENQAVFLKDVLLRLPFPWPAASLEVGDCQGSDSPIPQHLAQVQNYLLQTDLLVYVISSRVGLRRADYKFLGDILRMRSWEHVLFVVNLDLAEFDHPGAVRELTDRLARELRRLYPQPPIFSFSALNLLLARLQARGEPLSTRDQALLAVWEGVPEMVRLSRDGAESFAEEFQRLIAARHSRLLLSGCLSRLQAVARSLEETTRLHQQLLGNDLETFGQVKKRLLVHRQPLQGVLRALISALKGMAEDLKQALRKKIDVFFDSRHGDVGRQISQFIDSYQADLSQLELGDKLSSFMPGLYLVYQGFQRQLLAYLTEEINVRILEFVRQQDDWLQTEVSRLLAPLAATLQDAVTRYYDEIRALGIPTPAPTLDALSWQPPADLHPRLFSLELHMDWRLRREALMRLGVSLVNDTLERLRAWWSKDPPGAKRHRLVQSLTGALGSIKKYARQELATALLDYSEGMKFQYFFPLVDHLVTSQENAWTTALSALLVDFDSLQQLVVQQEDQKNQRRQRLAEVLQHLARINDGCEKLQAWTQSDFS